MSQDGDIVDPVFLPILIDVSGEAAPLVAEEEAGFVVSVGKKMEIEADIGQIVFFFDAAVSVFHLEEALGAAVMAVIEVGIT